MSKHLLALAELPAWILKDLVAPEPKRNPDAPDDGAKLKAGARNDTLFRMARSMRAKGFADEAIGAALVAENEVHCDPPLDPAEVQGIAESAVKYPTGESEPTQAQELVALACADAELFHDEVSEPHAAVMTSGHRALWRLGGRDFRRWLAGRYWAKAAKAAGAEPMRGALAVLEAKACFEGPRQEVHTRAAQIDGALWLDLSDRSWRAVKITAAGWEIVDKLPVFFRRYPHQAPQVEPRRGGACSGCWTFYLSATGETSS